MLAAIKHRMPYRRNALSPPHHNACGNALNVIRNYSFENKPPKRALKLRIFSVGQYGEETLA